MMSFRFVPHDWAQSEASMLREAKNPPKSRGVRDKYRSAGNLARSGRGERDRKK